MSRVIVTRGRHGGGWLPKRRRRFRDWEDAPQREKMSMGRGSKFHGEYLGPLKRFLQRRVGHRWDDVYSEIARGLRSRGVMQEHLLFHLRHMVAVHVVVRDGELFHHDEGAFRPVWGLYVCPRSRRLKARPRKRRQAGRPR